MKNEKNYWPTSGVYFGSALVTLVATILVANAGAFETAAFFVAVAIWFVWMGFRRQRG